MNERGSELYHINDIIGELIEIRNMLQLLQSEKNQLLMQQAIYSATAAVDIRRTANVAVDIRRPHFGYRECAFSVMLERLEVETGISGKGASVGAAVAMQAFQIAG